MPDIVMTLFLVAALLIVVSLLQPLATRLSLPHSVLLAGLGIGLGILSVFPVGDVGLGPVGGLLATVGEVRITADAILYVFLPILLFQTGLTVDVRRMMDDFAPILLMAVVAVVVCTLFVGFALASVSSAGLVACLVVGAIIATTDPVAVVAIFRDLGAPRRLSILVEGESVFNDAAAIALFTVLVGILITGGEVGVAGAAFTFAKLFLGGLAAGFLAARAAAVLLRPLRNLPLAETTVTVGLAYLVFIVAEHYVQVSGIVAVVTAALVIGSTGRMRLTPESWRRLMQVWDQLGFWASTLIFIVASMLVPRFLIDIGIADAALLAVLVVAALVARAAVLWGLLPLLSAAGLAERVGHAYRLVILWGGLRGAVTLALALAVTENPLLSPETKRFVAVLATGFVLFTLLVNATTLRPVIRMLGLDRLDPVEEAVRNRAIALALANVAERIGDIARDYHLSPERTAEAVEAYEARIRLADADAGDRLTATQQIELGLIALSGREEELYLDHHAGQVISHSAMVALIATAGRLRDGVKSGGLEGYVEAAEASLRFPFGLRAAHALHRLLRLEGPLARRLADRFESLLISRLVIEELAAFTRAKLRPLLGRDTCNRLGAVLSDRRESCERALEALRLQYPDYAGALEQRFLRQAALRMEDVEYRALLSESVISQEIHADLRRRLDVEWQAVAARPPLDLGLNTADLVRRFPMFEGLPDGELAAVGGLLRPRLAYPGERLVTKGERGDAMYLISSGAVEVVLPEPVRLGRGDFFGELALLTNRRRVADVVAIGYCRLLALNGRDFRRFLKAHPEIRARIRAVADERLKRPDEAAA
ncbi:MAG TPA: cation:proton antiporter [Alphaproteobacteria bacterium]|nr:cation:proton antiporter [Alphaproteobacteria bacterium]